jgi:hypothetical protein
LFFADDESLDSIAQTGYVEILGLLGLDEREIKVWEVGCNFRLLIATVKSKPELTWVATVALCISHYSIK